MVKELADPADLLGGCWMPDCGFCRLVVVQKVHCRYTAGTEGGGVGAAMKGTEGQGQGWSKPGGFVYYI